MVLKLVVVTVLVALAIDGSNGTAAQDPAQRPSAEDSNHFGDVAALDNLNLTVIDNKIALSLAIETHAQIELLDYALPLVNDPKLKLRLQAQRDMFVSLLDVLCDLTGGRTASLLAAANVPVQPRRAERATPARPAALAKGGVRAVIGNATHAAILRVRLEIAAQYASLLRADLEAAPRTDFDRLFAAADTIHQMEAIAILRVFEGQASDGFAKVINRARVAAETHLSEGKHLAAHFNGTKKGGLP